MTDLTPNEENLRTKIILNLIQNNFRMRNSGSFLIEEVFSAIEDFLLSIMNLYGLSSKVNNEHIDHPSSFHTDNFIQKVFELKQNFPVDQDGEFMNGFKEYLNIFFDCTITLHQDFIRSKSREISKGFTEQVNKYKVFLESGLDPTVPLSKGQPIKAQFSSAEMEQNRKDGILVGKKYLTWKVDSPDDVIEIKDITTSRGTKTKIIESIPTLSRSFNKTPKVSMSKLFDKLSTQARGLSGCSVRQRKKVVPFVDAAGFLFCRTELIKED